MSSLTFFFLELLIVSLGASEGRLLADLPSVFRG